MVNADGFGNPGRRLRPRSVLLNACTAGNNPANQGYEEISAAPSVTADYVSEVGALHRSLTTGTDHLQTSHAHVRVFAAALFLCFSLLALTGSRVNLPITVTL